SVSLTLNALCSICEVSYSPGTRNGVSWIAEEPRSKKVKSLKIAPLQAVKLSEAGITRVQRHVERVRGTAAEILPHYGIAVHKNLATEGTITLRTANTFPASSGIASSASSFAAITLGTAYACAQDPAHFEKAWSSEVGLRRAFARVSRRGS